MIELRPGDPRYPALLGAIPAPPALFVRGALSDDDALALAIVGSRRPTPYGLAVAAAKPAPFLAESPRRRAPVRTASSRTVLNSLHAGRTSCQNYQSRGAAPCAGRRRRRASSDDSRTGVTRAECSVCWLQTSRSTSSSSLRARGSIPHAPRRCS